MPQKYVVNTLFPGHRDDNTASKLLLSSLEGIFQTTELFHSSSKHIIEFILLGFAMLMGTHTVTNIIIIHSYDPFVLCIYFAF